MHFAELIFAEDTYFLLNFFQIPRGFLDFLEKTGFADTAKNAPDSRVDLSAINSVDLWKPLVVQTISGQRLTAHVN